MFTPRSVDAVGPDRDPGAAVFAVGDGQAVDPLIQVEDAPVEREVMMVSRHCRREDEASVSVPPPPSRPRWIAGQMAAAALDYTATGTAHE